MGHDVVATPQAISIGIHKHIDMIRLGGAEYSYTDDFIIPACMGV